MDTEEEEISHFGAKENFGDLLNIYFCRNYICCILVSVFIIIILTIKLFKKRKYG